MNLPAQLLERGQWLTWRLEKDPKRPEKTKLLKVPYYVDGGRRYGEQGTERDRRRLAKFQACVDVAPRAGLELGDGGIGFAFLSGDGLIGIDLDGVLDEGTGELSARALEIVKRCASYTEYSPSGKGLHIFVAGETETNKFDPIGVELYCGAQYFTVTGKHYAGTPLDVREISSEALAWLHAQINDAKEEAKKAKAQGRAAPAPRPGTSTDNDFQRVNDAAMANLSAWVLALFPAARSYKDGYRVSSADLGRDLQEELSILPSGIVDWGVNDQGDARNGRRTPIDLVIEWSSNKTPKAALTWLSGQLGITVSTLKKSKRPSGPPGDEPPASSGSAGGPSDGLPKIRWIQGKLPECIDQAEDALIKAGAKIYQRAGMLVRVVKRDTPSVRHYKRPPGSLGVVPIDTPYLIESMTRAAYWEKFSSQKDAWVRTNAPEQAAVTLLSRRGHWMVPKLWSVISSPTLRPDGTVLQEPGYDAATHTWYDPCGIEFPKIPESPTYDDAKASLEKLSKAFGSFPFENAKADKAVALSLVLSAILRRSLPSAPLGVITAPVMASGKTLLADCISILATGSSSPAMKYADTDEEFTKTMLAVLAEGDQVVMIDNVERPLQSDTLCVILTSETFRQRMLGRTEMMTVPTTTQFLATGNHIVLAGDLRTRALLCRIDPKVERPEERQFTTELRSWMIERRPELVAAALTIVRAFISTGQEPKDFCPQWGRFERWSDMVRAPLIWLDEADPCSTLKALERDDPDRIELARVILTWEEAFKKDERPGRSAREAIDRALKARNDPPNVDPEGTALDLVLREICRDREGAFSAKRLSYWIGKHLDRIVDGKRFVRAGELEHTLLYKVEAVKKK